MVHLTEKNMTGHHKNIYYKCLHDCYALVGVGWIVVFRQVYKRVGQLMCLLVCLSNPMFLDVHAWYVAKSEKKKKKNWTHKPPNSLLLWAIMIVFWCMYIDGCMCRLCLECSLYCMLSPTKPTLGGVAPGELFLVHMHTVHSSCQWNLM